MPRNRRLAIVAALGIVEVWILGLMMHSLCVNCNRAAAAQTAQAGNGGGVTSIQTGPAPRVVIDAGDAALTVSVRPGGSVAIVDRTQPHGWGAASGPQTVRFERTADGVRIDRSARAGGFRLGWSAGIRFGWSSPQLTVIVPPQALVDVANAGTMTVAGLRAAASMHSDDGSIAVRDMRGALTVTTGDGRIELRDVEAPRLNVSSGDGRIVLDDVRADSAAVGTADGRIAVTRSLLRGGKIHTANGRIEMGLDPLSNVTLRVRASAGKIVARPPLTVTGGADDGTPALIRVGDGTGRLEVGSDDGSIKVVAEGVEPT